MATYCADARCHNLLPCPVHPATGQADGKQTMAQTVAASDRERNGGHAQFSVNQIMRAGKQIYGSKLCTLDHETGTARTYAETADRVAKFGTALRRLLHPCGRVAIIALNSFRYFESLFAVSHGGGWVVPINIRLAPPEIAETLNDCETEMVLLDAAFIPLIAALKKDVPTLRYVILLGEIAPEGAAVNAVSEDLIKNTEAERATERYGDDIYGLFYTGGTTGKSKGVMSTHNNICANAYGMAVTTQLTGNDNWLHIASMFHAADQAGTYITTMVGGAHYFVSKFAALDVLKAWSKYRITTSLMVPTMFAMMTQHPDASTFDLTSTRLVMYGGSPMPDAVRDASIKLMGAQAKLVQVYGMTEAAPLVTVYPADISVIGHPKMGSVGLAVPHVQIKIMDEKDNEVAAGVVGEVCVRGPNVMKGYFGLKDRSAEALKNGWYHTGDGGYLDEEGFLYIKDRVKDMIISGGENVYSAEVENCIGKFPGVAMCAVIGIPDSVLVEKILAIVVPTQIAAEGSVNEKAIIEHCRGLIAGYKCPKEVVVRKWDEPLPLSGANKILKTKLRQPYWQKNTVLTHGVYADNQRDGGH